MKKLLTLILFLCLGMVTQAQINPTKLSNGVTSLQDITNELDAFLTLKKDVTLPNDILIQINQAVSDAKEEQKEHHLKEVSDREMFDYFANHYWSSQFWDDHTAYKTIALNAQLSNQNHTAQIQASTNPLCIDGNFENGNTLFTVEKTTNYSGSTLCAAIPSLSGWVPPTTSIPSAHMSLVSAGSDPNVAGLLKTHNGNGALRVNSSIGIGGTQCGSFGAEVDRARATFTLNASMLQLSFWYAIVMENPTGHTNTSPFVTIRAVDVSNGTIYGSLCYDPSQNNMLSTPTICNQGALWQPWTCGTFNFPSSAIGQNIYFEVIVADCGLGGHFAYAYIDDICASCNTGGNDGDVTIGMTTDTTTCYQATASGTYTFPTTPGYNTAAISIQLKRNNINIGSPIIPTVNAGAQTFTAIIPKTLLAPSLCYDLVVKATFTGPSLPTAISNAEVVAGINNDFCVPADTSCCPKIFIKVACDTDYCYSNNLYLYVVDQNNQDIISDQNPYTVTWKLLPNGPTYTNMSYLPITDVTQDWEVTVTSSTGCIIKDTLDIFCCEHHTVKIFHDCPPNDNPCDITHSHPLRVKIDNVVVNVFNYANGLYNFTLKWFKLVGSTETPLVNGPLYVGQLKNKTFIVEMTDTFGCKHRDTITFNCCNLPVTVVNQTACGSYTWACNGVTYTTSGIYYCVNAQNVCDTTKLILTISNGSTSSSTITANCKYLWTCNNITYTQSGTYTCVTTLPNGCTNTAILQLTIIPGTLTVQNIAVCNSYTLPCNGQVITVSGNYDCINGCDTTRYHVTITPGQIMLINATACNSYTWACNGTTYTTSGIYTCINPLNPCITNELHLTITPQLIDVQYATACDNYLWQCNGQIYFVSGVYTCADPLNPCIIHELHLTITPQLIDVQYATACDSYTWLCNGQVYNTTGNYICTDPITPCTIHQLHLTITPSTPDALLINTCDSYTWPCNGVIYTTSGNYVCVDPQNPCVIRHLDLTITPSVIDIINITACDSYNWTCPGVIYVASGIYTCVDPLNPCLIHQLNLTITPQLIDVQHATACDSYTWQCNGQVYLLSGIYTCVDPLNPCVIHELHLTVTPSTPDAILINACDSYTWPCNGVIYTTSGNYICVDPQNPCVIHHLDLTITPSVIDVINITACDSYNWTCSGIVYVASGIYTCVDPLNPCIIHELHLTITPQVIDIQNATACNNYVWQCNGQVYFASGIYTCIDPLNPCIIHKLHLTITPPVIDIQNATACNSYIWPCNGQVYLTSGVYTCIDPLNPCIIHKLHLTITPPVIDIQNATACNSYTWPCNGQIYLTSGVYTCIDPLNPCAVHQLNLNLNFGTSTVLNATSCNSYTWSSNGVTYFASGTYTIVVNCNTKILNLVINQSPIVTATNVVYCSGSPAILNGSPAGGTWNLPNPYTGTATSYTYTYVSTAGCVGSATANISVSTVGAATIIPPVAVTSTTATISWNAVPGSTIYYVWYRPATSTAAWVTPTTTATSLTLTGLAVNTQYEVKIRNNNAACNQYGVFGNPVLFTTLNEPCASPTTLLPTMIVPVNKAKICWVAAAGATQYNIWYKLTTATTYMTATVNAPAVTFTTASLPVGTYELKIRNKCATGSYSVFSPCSFFTIGAVPKPSGTSTEGNTNFTVFPNPATNQLNIEFEAEKESVATLKLMDLTGRLLKEIQSTTVIGLNNINMSMTEFKPGNYILKMYENGNSVYMTKVSKVE
jgi:hypothetical protein